MPDPLHLSLYQVNTRVQLTALSRALGQEAGSYHVLRGKQVPSDVSPIALFAR